MTGEQGASKGIMSVCQERYGQETESLVGKEGGEGPVSGSSW